jgi:hypothetical protein
MTDIIRKRALAAARARKYRRRDKQGVAVYQVQAPQHRLLDALVGWGMPSALTERHDLAEAAVDDLVAPDQRRSDHHRAYSRADQARATIRPVPFWHRSYPARVGVWFSSGTALLPMAVTGAFLAVTRDV